MTGPNILELAKQRNANAIAHVINYNILKNYDITAKALLKDICLLLMLESAQVPTNKHQLHPSVQRSGS